MNEMEQLELAMQLSKAESEAGQIRDGNHGKPLAKTPATSCMTEQHKAFTHTPDRPRTKVEVRKATHTAVFVNKTNSDGTNDELEEALKQSLEELKNMRGRQDNRINLSDTERDLEKALELSRLEYDQSRNNTLCHEVQQGGAGGSSDVDEELQRALKLSKLEAEAKGDQSMNEEMMSQKRGRKDTTVAHDNDLQQALEQSRVEYEQHKSDTLITLNGEREPGTNIAPDNTELRQNPTSKLEEDLKKALEISRADYKYERGNIGTSVDEETEQSSSKKSKVQNLQDDDVAKALQKSKMECSKPEDSIALEPMHVTEDQTMDSDLERALKLSKIEYMQSTSCSLDEKQEDTESDVTILEENMGDFTPRERSVPALKLKCSSTPVKDSVLIDDNSDDVVPSSLASEWDPDPEDHDMFNALDHSTPAGSSKCSAILLDSQEFDDESLDAQDILVAEDVAKTNRRQLFSLEEENSVDNDFAFALKLQEELNNQVKGTDNDHDSSSNRRTSLELEDQLTCYRESQKEKYGTVSRKGDKSSCGIDFRRNVAAIACGKPVQIGIASPFRRPVHSQKMQDSHRVLGNKTSPASRIDGDKNGLLNSPKKQGLPKDDVCVIR